MSVYETDLETEDGFAELEQTGTLMGESERNATAADANDVRAALARVSAGDEVETAAVPEVDARRAAATEAWTAFSGRHPEMVEDEARAPMVALMNERPELLAGAATASDFERAWEAALEISAAGEAAQVNWQQAGDLALERALAVYSLDEGDDLADIVGGLVTHLGPDDPRFGEFLASIDEEDAQAVVSWLGEFEAHQQAEQGQLQVLQQIEAMAQAQRDEQAMTEAQDAALAEIAEATPDFEQLVPLLPSILRATAEIESPEDVKPALELAVRAAGEVHRAARVDQFKDNFLRSAFNMPRPGDPNFEAEADSAHLPKRQPTELDVEKVRAEPKSRIERVATFRAAFDHALIKPGDAFRAEAEAAALRAEKAREDDERKYGTPLSPARRARRVR